MIACINKQEQNNNGVNDEIQCTFNNSDLEVDFTHTYVEISVKDGYMGKYLYMRSLEDTCEKKNLLKPINSIIVLHMR